MRYLDEARAESPNHGRWRCARPGCDVLTPANEMWRVTLRYRELGNYWDVSEAIDHCCSRECAEAVAHEFGADEVKCLDHDAEGERMKREIEEMRAEYHRAKQAESPIKAD